MFVHSECPWTMTFHDTEYIPFLSWTIFAQVAIAVSPQPTQSTDTQN